MSDEELGLKLYMPKECIRCQNGCCRCEAFKDFVLKILSSKPRIGLSVVWA